MAVELELRNGCRRAWIHGPPRGRRVRGAPDKLKEALARADVKWHGAPVWARYDPPWKPWFLRRNEILLEVD
jgi:hypothetical protein